MHHAPARADRRARRAFDPPPIGVAVRRAAAGARVPACALTSRHRGPAGKPGPSGHVCPERSGHSLAADAPGDQCGCAG